MVLQIILLAIFLHFFGQPAVDKFLRKDVMVVETKKDTDGIPLPAITISGLADPDVPCFSQNLSTRCIETNTHNLSENLEGMLLGYGKRQEITLGRDCCTQNPKGG